MKSRMKLIATITSICLAVGMLFVGVYAATTRVDFGITGNILYEVEDTYVEITTKMYKSTTLLSKGQVADTVEELANLSFTQIDSKGLVHLTQNDDTYSSLEDTTGNGEYDGVDELTLTFSTSGSNVAFAYFIVMNVKNLTTNENIYAVMQDEREDCENIFEYDNALQENILKTEDNRNIVIGLTVDKFNTPITSGSFTYGINVGTGDIARSEQMTSKVTVEDGAYYWTENAKGVVVLDPAVDGVTELYDDDGTNYSEAITAVIIREGLETINENSLNSNSNLKKIVLSLNNTDISSYFCTGDSLFILKIDSDQDSNYTSQNSSGEELNCVIEKSSKKLINGSNNTKFDKLPENVLVIGQSAFLACEELSGELVIPDSVTEIGHTAFQGCTGLTSIEIPDSISEIGSNIFMNCTGLESIVIPDSVTEIGRSAFYGCTGLTSIDLGSVQSVGDSAFSGCTGLTSIVIPDTVTSIGANAFYYWTAEQSIYFEGTMPENLHADWNYNCNAKIYLNGVLQN